MDYLSTRGGSTSKRFTEVLLAGLALDGGLYMPETYPQVSPDEMHQWRNLSYSQLAFEIIRKFATDIPEPDLRLLIDKTYTANIFGSADITPLKTLTPGLHLLCLSGGPTLAFKDVAMQLLGNLFEYVLERDGAELNILGATSGDTGSAAEYAMRGKRGIRVFMLSPHGKMSAFQRAQMYTLSDPNIVNLAIEGVFDDCQNIVKAVSHDHAFKAALHIGTVNSINWARLLAQVVYYFKGYFAATSDNGQQVSFSVPSGNFGNICAGHVARSLGLPIKRLILATNENDIMSEFFQNGFYRPRKSTETYITSSPSMDISKPSNFERFVFDLVGRDAAVVCDLWKEIDCGGAFDLASTHYFGRIADFGFVSGTSTHTDRLKTIRRVWEDYQVEIDPHTADGLHVALPYQEEGIPLLCLETALPAKFDETMTEALGHKPGRPEAFNGIELLPQRAHVMPPDVEEIKKLIMSQCC